LQRPEQHSPCERHTSFKPRHEPRHSPTWHGAPKQQSLDCVHDSLSWRHCVRHRPVSGLQNPSQHSKSIWHAASAALQKVSRHSPPLQVPAQQSPVLRHAPPALWQLAFRQTAPVQVAPLQHSSVVLHGSPGAVQVGSPQRPERQLFEQQIEADAQPSPTGAQPQVPSARHWPSQQSLWNEHASPAGRHGSRQRPSTHEPWQHSASSPHG
jgi:hypothetical protein